MYTKFKKSGRHIKILGDTEQIPHRETTNNHWPGAPDLFAPLVEWQALQPVFSPHSPGPFICDPI